MSETDNYSTWREPASWPEEDVIGFIETRMVETERTYHSFGSLTRHIEDWHWTIREIIKFHQNWPVLVEGPMEFDVGMSDDPMAQVSDYYTFTMTKEIAWLTHKQYVERFGEKPLTSPILNMIACSWVRHPEFNNAWLGGTNGQKNKEKAPDTSREVSQRDGNPEPNS